MALFAGLNTPQPTDPQNRAKQGSGNLGRGLLQLFMMQNEAGATAKKAGDAKAAQEAGNARVGQVANEVSQLRNSGKDTLAVMDVFRKNGDLFNNPVTRPGMISLAANEKATEDMISGFEKAKLDTIQKKTQESLLKQQIDMASQLAARGGAGAQSVASLFVPNEEGVMPVSDLSNYNTVSGLFSQHMPQGGSVDIKEVDVGGKPFAIFQVPGSKAFQIKDLGALSAVDMVDYRSLTRLRDNALLDMADPIKGLKKTELQKIVTDAETKLSNIMQKVAAPVTAQALPQDAPPAPMIAPTSSMSPKTKAQRANELSIAHPDWTREQIIEAVNREMP